MSAYVIDGICLICILIFLYSIQIEHPFSGKLLPDYLSAKTCGNIKGILSIVVLLHHLRQKITGGIIFPLFGGLGYLSVSVYFFISGYGLIRQYKTKPNYSKGFLFRRLPTILLPYILTTIIYWAELAVIGAPITFRQVLNELYWGTPIVIASWYIMCISFFYIGFGILMHICRKNDKWIVPGMFAWSCVYLYLCLNRGYLFWWYNTMPALLLV